MWFIVTRRFFYFRDYGWYFTALFIVLFTSTSIGAMVFYFQQEIAPASNTIRSLMIYTLAPAAFLVGRWAQPRSSSFFVRIMAVFLGINLIAVFFRDDLSFLASFYGLGTQYAKEFYDTRAVGILGNPNITALMMSVLLIFVLSSRRHPNNNSGRFDFVIASWLAASTAVLMISRNQFIAVGLITFFAMFRIGWRQLWRQTVVLGVLVVAIFAVGYIADRPIQKAVGFNPPTLLVDRFELALPGTESGKSDSVSRPLLELDSATDRWSSSVIVGTGFEASENFDHPSYHNDWLTVAVSSGAVGLVAFGLIVILLARIEPLYMVLFIFPALTNSFVFAPQHFIGMMLLVGVIYQRNSRKSTLCISDSY
jgi:O-antigen ligase